MASEVGSDDGNMVRCPIERRGRRSVELLARLAPTRSLLDTLIAERGVAPHDALARFAREFAYQARALEAGHDCDEAIVRLRIPVDAHLAHAIEICRAYQEAADRRRPTSPRPASIPSRPHRAPGGRRGTGRPCAGADAA